MIYLLLEEIYDLYFYSLYYDLTHFSDECSRFSIEKLLLVSKINTKLATNQYDRRNAVRIIRCCLNVDLNKFI